MQTRPTDARLVPQNEGDQPIPGFRLIRPRGRGGFGEVWEAEAAGGFRVALKFVRLSNRALDSELRALEFVRGIHHPNLLANFGAWQVDDTLIIGMELADRSLWDRFIEAANQGLSGIPRGELLGYLSEVAAGIGHLNDYRHTLDGRTGFGVQHRDLKPTNILLFGGGAKVADLGMARAMEGEVAGHTGIWTYSYAAPEFFRGETTRQSDQYGLAVTYCQLRTGRLPFEGNAASVTAGHLFGEPDLEALPEAERPVVERALSKKPGERWPSCRAFADALRAITPDQVPDELIAPDNSYDIPREFRSSTGTGAVPSFGTGPDLTGSRTGSTGWAGFASTDGPEVAPAPSSSSFDLTAAFAPPDGESVDSSDRVETRVFPAVPTGPGVPLEAIGPTSEVRPGASSPWTHLGRNVAVATVAAIALVTAGLYNPAHHGQAPAAAEPGPPDPALIIGAGIGSAASPDPLLTAPPQVPDETPTPLPAPPIEVRTSLKPVEPEPAPAQAADDSRPASTSTASAVSSIVGPTVRSDLTPAPRVRAASVPPEGREGRATVDPAIARASKAGPGEDRPDEVSGQATLGPPRDPARAVAALTRGLEFLARNSFDRALAEFDEAIRLDPGQPANYLHRALARHRAGYPKSALADYDEAIRLRPGDARAFIARGQAHHDLSAYGRAIEDFDQAVGLRPGDADPRFRRAKSRYWSEDYAGSVVDFTEVLRLDPANAQASEFRADALARLGSPTGRVPAPGASRPTSTPSTIPMATPSTAPMATPSTAPVLGANPAIRETLWMAPSEPKAKQKSATPPRRSPLRRLLPWPWPRAR